MPVPLPPSLASTPSSPNLSYVAQRRPSQLYPTQAIPKRTVELRKSQRMGHRRNHSAGAAAVVFSLVAFCGSVAEAAPIPDASGIQFRAVDYKSSKDKLVGEVNGKLNGVDAKLAKRRVDGTAKPNELACLDSTADEKVINSLLFYGGEGSVVQLCAGAEIVINNPIQFSHPGQELSTIGKLRF